MRSKNENKIIIKYSITSFRLDSFLFVLDETGSM